jgi:hypothetical protein
MSKGALIFALFVLGASLLYPAAAQQQPTWVFERCFTNDCIAKTLNGLSPERAAEAKLVADERQWSKTTYVWYRR